MKNRYFVLLFCLISASMMFIYGCGSNATGGGGGGGGDGGGTSGTTNPAEHLSTVDATGGHSTSLVLDSTGKPHISYYKSSTFHIYYTKWTGLTWETTDIDSGVGAGTCLRLGTQDGYAIAYYDSAGLSWHYGDDSGGGGSSIDPFSYSAGQYYGLSMVLDANENPRISYYNDSQNCLKYAEFNGSTWNIATVDAVGDVGRGSSIALNLYGSPEISYLDQSTHHIRYAKWTGSSWVTSEVDDCNNAALYNCTSLAINPTTGMRWITYKLDDPSGQIMGCASSENGSSWTISQIIDATSDSGGYSSVKLDNNGNPWVAYYNGNGAWIASLESGSWVLTSIEAGSEVGLQCSLALNSSNEARVSYYDANGHAYLKYYWQ